MGRVAQVDIMKGLKNIVGARPEYREAARTGDIIYARTGLHDRRNREAKTVACKTGAVQNRVRVPDRLLAMLMHPNGVDLMSSPNYASCVKSHIHTNVQYAFNVSIRNAHPFWYASALVCWLDRLPSDWTRPCRRRSRVALSCIEAFAHICP